MRLLKVIVVIGCLTASLILAQNTLKAEDDFAFTINQKAVGVIRDKKTRKQRGSAFFAGSQKHIFTCAHVATKGEFVYRGVSLSKDMDLKSVYFLPKYDLSVFALAEPIDGEPLKFGDIKKIRPGDIVIYVGWDKNLSKMKINKATVSSLGSSINNGVIIDFLEFQGKGMPGYSGGPVFDRDGNVIAIMREAWKKQGVKGGKVALMNRAFSTEILSILDDEVYSIKGSNKEVSADSDALKDLIDIKTD